ncbi:hypothetical protein EB796_017673 [Bugula neritina]|uniref:Uncharacterized protein n=1 Tax=Bugula neritina TaxID=10212 RepID=A0A7J7JEF8_BUGNE|nr:hypothetical protein EB796_017673 [Bugula neritina]
MQHTSSPGNALISTKVITGSRSAPDLHVVNENRALEAYGMAVPDIMPLETLHNSLTLAHFEKFLTNVIDMGTITPKRSYMGASNSLNGSRASITSEY